MKYGGDVLTKAVVDAGLGRVIVFPVTRAKDVAGLRIQTVEVVEKEKLRVTRDLKFSRGGVAVRKRRRMRDGK